MLLVLLPFLTHLLPFSFVPGQKSSRDMKAYSDCLLRSLMTLHNSRPTSALSTEFIDMTLRGMSFICAKFNSSVEQVNVMSVSPFPPHSLYLAALTQDRLWRETGDWRSRKERDELILMLKFFVRRWGSAGESPLLKIHTYINIECLS